MLTADAICARLAAAWPESGAALVVLFGSVAAGKAGPLSDIDLAVSGLDTDALDALRAEICARLGSDQVDLADIGRAPPLVCMSIARTGRVLFERAPGVFAAFASLAMRRFADTAKLRALHERSIQRFLEQRGLT